MKRFIEFIDDREKTGLPELSDDTIYRICKVAWRKYKKLTEEFIEQLAEKDPEIKSIIDELKNGDGPVSQDDLYKNKDEVVPPEADGSPGMNDEGGEEGE
jgi:hypothetical protein